jgi:hypothetical protein
VTAGAGGGAGTTLALTQISVINHFSVMANGFAAAQ